MRIPTVLILGSPRATGFNGQAKAQTQRYAQTHVVHGDAKYDAERQSDANSRTPLADLPSLGFHAVRAVFQLATYLSL